MATTSNEGMWTYSDSSNETNMSDLSPIPDPMKQFFAATYLVLFVFVLFGNTMTILAIVRTPQLRVQANLYVFHLALADSLVGVGAGMVAFFYMDFSLQFFNNYKFFCISVFALNLINTAQSLLTLTLMAIDRLVQVAFPFGHTRHFTKKRVKRLLVASWLLSLLVGIGLFAWYSASFNTGCFPMRIFRGGTFNSVVLPLAVLTTFVITKACYTAIACIARKHRQKLAFHSSSLPAHAAQETNLNAVQEARPTSLDTTAEGTPPTSLTITQGTQPASLHTTPQRAGIQTTSLNITQSAQPTSLNTVHVAQTTAREDNSGSGLRRHWSGSNSGNQKSLVLFITVNTIFSFCWAPYVLMNFVSHFVEVPELLVHVVLLLVMSNSGMNFVVYARRNQHFARAYRDILTRCFRRQ